MTREKQADHYIVKQIPACNSGETSDSDGSETRINLH